MRESRMSQWLSGRVSSFSQKSVELAL